MLLHFDHLDMETLTFNYRGQTDSPFSEGLSLDEDLIVADAVALIRDLEPANPLLVGLSIGGLFAIKTYFSGIQACGLVLINTLRKKRCTFTVDW